MEGKGTFFTKKALFSAPNSETFSLMKTLIRGTLIKSQLLSNNPFVFKVELFYLNINLISFTPFLSKYVYNSGQDT